MLRREFLFGLSLSPLGFLAARPAFAERGQYSIVMGPPADNSVVFSILRSRGDLLSYKLVFLDGSILPQSIRPHSRPESDAVVETIEFKDVPLDQALTLIVLGAHDQVKDVRPLRLNIIGPQKEVRVAALSCAAGYFYDSSIWQQLCQAKPDMVLFLGDNVYGDRPNMVTKRPADPQQLWSQYVKARRQYDFYFCRELVPTLATWDDHDFGIDDGDRSYRYARESLEIFKIFWPQPLGDSGSFLAGPGVSARWSGPLFDLVTLDNRSFRTNANEFGVATTVLGDSQKYWLERQLRRSDRPLWLINGQQFFGGYRGKYSFDYDFPMDFEWLVAHLRAVDRPTGFLSGDVHFSEVMDIEPAILGRHAVEITSSSMHSVTFPGQHNWHRNPRRRQATSRHNFVLLDVVGDGRQLVGRATSVGSSGEVFLTEAFRLV